MKWSQATPNYSIWTVDQLAYHCRIDSDISSTTDEQDYLSDLQNAAVEFAETAMGTSLITREITAQYWSRTPSNVIYFPNYGDQWHILNLPRGPIQSIVSVTDANGLIDPRNYTLEGTGNTDQLQITVNYTTPVTIVYEAGYTSNDEYNSPIISDIPADIRQAIRTHVATLYAERQSARDRSFSAVPHSLEAFYQRKAENHGDRLMTTPPNIGDLRHRIVVEQITGYSNNAYNEPTAIYGTWVCRWAKVEQARAEGLSLLQANTRTQLQHLTISIRYLAGLTVNNRIRFGHYNEETLTAEQMGELTAEQLETLGSEGTAPRYFSINGVDDLDNLRTWHVLDCVEVTA